MKKTRLIVNSLNDLLIGLDAMAETLKAVFDDLFKHLRYDAKLASKIHLFERRFVNRNEDHIAFFSGNLTGVNRVIFSEHDRKEWFDNVLDVDERELRKRIIATPDINENWKVTSDPFNLSCMYLAHAFYNSKMPVKEKIVAMEDSLLVFYYRIITSKLQNNFPYLVSKESAEAVYAQLSKKFALKRYGSWSGLVKARVADIIAPGALHEKTLKTFQPDKAVMYLTSDSQGRIRDTIDLQHDMLTDVRENDKRIISVTSSIEIDGEQILKDLTRNINSYMHYLHGIAGDERSFIKDELVKVISTAMPTMSPLFLREVLRYISKNYLLDKGNKIEKLLNDTLLHAFEVLTKEYKGNIRKMDMTFVILKLKGVYQSSRSTEKRLIDLRSVSDDVIGETVKSKSEVVRAAVRTGVLLYIIVRVFTKSHYSA